MKSKNFFNTLVARASEDKPPQVNIADRVIAALTAKDQRLDWIWDRPLMWIAGLSSAIAVPVVTAAVYLHNIWIGPLYEISKAISWVM
jgi:hypothetical protein